MRYKEKIKRKITLVMKSSGPPPIHNLLNLNMSGQVLAPTAQIHCLDGLEYRKKIQV